ncbi:MAG: SpoIIE family protein phosphatase [Selenomonadaceae bacterium]|nr:SpoIIE family protein phosphatase [Selenomonadaceae bacterium]
MIEKLEKLIAVFIGTDRTDIKNRVLRLVLAGSLLTFIEMALLSLTGLLITWNILDSRGQLLGEESAGYTERFSERQAKLNLSNSNRLRAQLINNQLFDVQLDVLLMSREATHMLSAPEEYLPRSLPNTSARIIEPGTVYVHYSPELVEGGISAELQREIGIVSNIADEIDSIIGTNPCAFVGSKNGYVIRADVMPPTVLVTSLSREPERSTYDNRTRSWYKFGSTVEEPTFTDVYITQVTGEPCVSCVMPYFDGAGDFAGVVGIDCNPTEIYAQINKSTIGRSGFCFILDANGEVLYSTQVEGDFVTGTSLFESNSDLDVAGIGRLMTAGVTGVTEITSKGEKYYVAYTPMSAANWSIATVIEKSEVVAPAMIARNNILDQIEDFKASFGNLFRFLLSLSLVLLVAVMYGLFRMSLELARRFVKPIQQLSDGVRDIASGDFDKHLEIKTGDEIEHLATCFNGMTAELKNYMSNLTKVTADRERIATELDVAKEIQQSILPKTFDFGRSDFKLYATMHAAKEVGGDFYDFYLLDDKHLMVTIADVSGKGVPAALFMMISKTILKNFALTMANADDVGALVSKTNQQLCQNNDAMMFVTMFVGLLDLNTGRFIYVNGGHNPPLIYRASTERFDYLTSSARNYALGLMDDAEFEQETLDLAAGDALFLYTDGVTEALNTREELYGEKRLEACLNQPGAERLTVERMLALVRESLNEYADGAPQTDDITMIGLKFNG